MDEGPSPQKQVMCQMPSDQEPCSPRLSSRLLATLMAPRILWTWIASRWSSKGVHLAT